MENVKADNRCLYIFQSRIPTLKKNNGEWIGKCPFHDDSTPSFSLHNKKGDWLFYCFGCLAKGSVIDFIQKMDSLSTGEAMKRVQALVGDSGRGKDITKVFKPIAEEPKVAPISLDTYNVVTKALIHSPEAEEYLKSRGIRLETAVACSVGFRTDLPGQEEKNWLCFPTFTQGFVTGIKYRCISKKKFSSQKKMVNGLFNAPRVDPFDILFVTEGEIDALSFEECGFRAVSIGAAGTKLTPEQKSKLLEAAIVYLAGDNDPVGQEAMNRLWKDLRERTYLLQWPSGIKDANELLMKKGRDGFKEEIAKLMSVASATIMPHVKSLQEVLANSERVNLADHPDRLRFPWPSVDKMAILLPGSVMAVSATNTKMGKTNWVKDVTLHNAYHGSVVLNYSCELTAEEFSTMVAAGVLHKNRNHLTKEDNEKAGKELGGIKYYIGRNPMLTTVGPVLDLIEDGVRWLGADIVVLDHIHFICRNSEKGSEISDQANAMQRLKNMAVQYGIKVIVVGQPRKAQASSRGKAIDISDFKGSETITSDADAIFRLHRERTVGTDSEAPPEDSYSPVMEVECLGARSKGDGGSYTKLQFVGIYATIVELERTTEEHF